MKTTKCEICGREIRNCNYKKHLHKHETNPGSFLKVGGYKLDHDDLFCKFCGKECKNRNSLAQHEIRCRLNDDKLPSTLNDYIKNGGSWNRGLTKYTDNRIKAASDKLHLRYSSGDLINPNKGKHHTQEEKDNLSIKMKDYLSNNPDKVPYLLNHSSKTSYPEKYFMDVFDKEHILLTYHYRVNKYELDFCDPVKMVDIEIDGDQHYLDKRIVKSDIDRDAYLGKLGWKIIRIVWSKYKRLSLDEKHSLIESVRLALVTQQEE